MNVHDYLTQLPAQYQNRAREYFVYRTNFTGTNQLAAGGAGTVTFSVQSDSDFLLTEINFRTNADGTPETAIDRPGITMQLNDTGSGRNLFQGAVPIDTVAGYGQRTYHLPWFFFINRASVISVELNNLVAGTAYDVRIIFGGVKLFQSRQGV